MLVPPYDDPFVIAGQGTAGREIVEDISRLGLALDCVVVNASGGGLTAGIALAVKARVPQACIYTAEPEGFDDHARSFRSGRRERNAALTGTMCDALMAQTPGQPHLRDQPHPGRRRRHRKRSRGRPRGRLRVPRTQAGGGAGRRRRARRAPCRQAGPTGKTAVVVLSGGNVDPELFARLVA